MLKFITSARVRQAMVHHQIECPGPNNKLGPIEVTAEGRYRRAGQSHCSPVTPRPASARFPGQVTPDLPGQNLGLLGAIVDRDAVIGIPADK
jgi:hypothetical protein